MPLCWRNRRATSLLEVVIASLITGIILACAGTLFVLGSRFHRRVQTSLDLQQECLRGAESVVRELSESNAASVAWGTAPPGLVFASPRNAQGRIALDSSNTVLWQKYICYYIAPVQGVPSLLRKEEYLAAATAVVPVPGALRTTAYYAGLVVPQRAVASDFQNIWGGAGAIHFQTGRTDVAGKYQFLLDTQVTLHN